MLHVTEHRLSDLPLNRPKINKDIVSTVIGFITLYSLRPWIIHWGSHSWECCKIVSTWCSQIVKTPAGHHHQLLLYTLHAEYGVCTGSVLAPIWTEMTNAIPPTQGSIHRILETHLGEGSIRVTPVLIGWRTGEPNISHWMRGRPRRQQQHRLGSLQDKIIFIGMIFKLDIYMISNTTNWITFEGLRPPGVMQRLT